MEDIKIKPLAEMEIEVIEQQTALNFPPKHRERFAMQQNGKAVYLIAWHEDLIVGHVLLKWDGTTDEPMRSQLKNCPHIEDLFVIPDYRSKGIGFLLMDTVEELCRQHGYSRVGLGIGVDNMRARLLYERRKYRDAQFGECRTTYPYINEHGQQRRGEEICVYLIKNLK